MNLVYSSCLALVIFTLICFLSNGMDVGRERQTSTAIISKLSADANMYRGVATGQNNKVALVFMAKSYGLLSASLHVAQYTNSGDVATILDQMKDVEEELEAYSQS